MWRYHADLLARPVPRYTSYPTAAEFHGGVGAAEMEAALAAVPAGAEVSLYLHIPYCHEICWYCGCNTGAANKRQRLAAYLDSIEAEIALVAARLPGVRVGRVAFGGGSPNAIAPEEFARLVRSIRTGFGADDAQLSVELDPRTLTAGFVAALGDAGVGRASLGVQTLEPHVQAAIGRVQPAVLVERTVAALRAAGIASINFDLMYGLPDQSLDDLAATLEATAALAPERIALFGYAHVPHLIPRQKRIDGSALPDPRQRFAQAELGHRMLTERGYRPVGFDHFALPHDGLATAAREGVLRRNFQGFTDDRAEVLIGLGASAISQFPGLLVQNEKNAGRYRMSVSAARLPAERGVVRSAEDRLRGRIIESLLCRGEAEVRGFPLGPVAERLAPFEARGLVAWDLPHLRLTAGALPYARAIAAAFDAYRDHQPRRFSNAV